ncbi:cyclophilin-like domain-containing protein [Tribonema minus]|uniref:Peptidyl-prolyl cis-trans isomerase n=1 Tax=Tribonema minus TaxID=303371 RepID=A0A836CET4_9STRA|nr:cyclophilin-like domain-containing protein [Tribonema minus]
MEPLTEANGYSSASAPTGKLVLELFGTEAPKTVEAFLSYITPEPADSGPSYASSLFTRLVPGRQLDGGRISGLNQISLAGSSQLQYFGRIFPATPSFESNALRHDCRGLLTKSKLEAGPEFTITLGPCPELDASNVVFGRVVEGEETLRALEQVPLYSSGSTQEEGSVADNWYRAQRSASLFVGRNVLRDERAVDRTGTFLRRVDVVRCGRLK